MRMVTTGVDNTRIEGKYQVNLIHLFSASTRKVDL